MPQPQSQTEHQDSGPQEGHIPGAGSIGGSQEGLDSDAPPVDKPSGRARRSKNTNGFAGSYLLFYAVSLVGVIPRCTVLLASHALPQAHASQAVTGFWDFWQSCADPANAFSDFSSRGIVYKVLVGSDHVFFGLGMMLACVAILYLTFPEACKSRRGAWRLGTSAAVLFLLWALYFVGVLSTLLADNITPAALDGLNWMRALFAVVTFASTYVGYVYVATTFTNIWQSCMNRCPGARSVVRSVFWSKLCVVVAVAGTFPFVARTTAVLYIFEALFESRIFSVVAASGLSRGLNFLVRWLVNRDTSLPVHIVFHASAVVCICHNPENHPLSVAKSLRVAGELSHTGLGRGGEPQLNILLPNHHARLSHAALEYPNAGRAG